VRVSTLFLQQNVTFRIPFGNGSGGILARVGGTRRPVLLEALVEWGEDHTDFEYNTEFMR